MEAWTTSFNYWVSFEYSDLFPLYRVHNPYYFTENETLPNPHFALWLMEEKWSRKSLVSR